jgi:hypothetical protein
MIAVACPTAFVALTLADPEPEEPEFIPKSPIGEGEILIFAAFAVVIGGVFAFDMIRTWWETNRWRRDARRRRRARF